MESVSQGSEKLSCYEYINPEYPENEKTLPQVYDAAELRNDGKTVEWYKPAEKYTHTELLQKAKLVAKGLMAQGLKRGDIVVAMGCQGSDGILMFLACSSIGCIFTAPYFYSPLKKTVPMWLNDLEPALVLCGDSMFGLMTERIFPALTATLIRMQEEEKTLPLIFYDTAAANSEECMAPNKFGRSLEELIESGAAIDEAEFQATRESLTSNEPSMITCSSGTTGKPKAVILSAKPFTNNYMWRQERIQFTPGTNKKMAIANMCTEDIALCDELTSSLIVGYDLLVLPQPKRLLDDNDVISELCHCIQQCRPNFVYTDQYYLSSMISVDLWREKYDLTSLEGCSLLSVPFSKKFRNNCMTYYPTSGNMYGLSEFYNALCPTYKQMLTKVETVGGPLPNCSVKIVDQNDNCVKRGESGHLLLKGPSMFLAYRGQPELTKAAFTEDGWFKTGDCAIMDEDGDIQIIGRMSATERYKVAGDVLYSAPIELILAGCEKIRECSVFGVKPDLQGDHEIIYAVVLKEGLSMTLEDVWQYAFDKMQTSCEWPARVWFMDKLPRHGSRNKVNKRKLIDDFKKILEEDEDYGLVEFNFN